MHDTRRTRIVLGVLVVAALALITINYQGGAGAPLGGLRSVGGSVFGSVESAASFVTRPVAAFADGLTGSGSQGKIDALQRQVVDLRAQLNRQQLSRYEEGQLSQLLQLAGRGRYRIVTASVIAAGAAYDDSVTIDAGRVDGIKPDETVLNGQGLVGTVTSVSATTSTVLLATDASVTVGVRLAGTGQIGVVSGTGKSMTGSGLLRLQVFDVNAILHPGQELVTFGSSGGRPYVPGVPVGVITKLEGTSSSLTKEALVRPFASDTALGVVGVVVVPPRTDPRFSVLPPRPSPSPTASASATASPGAGGTPSPGATPTPTTGRGTDVRRIAFSAALLLLATLIQVTVLDNLRLPFGAGPDLVLVVVVALALTGGPVEGMLGGFCAGLALDVAPPATHLVGQYALVFCLVGYAAGRVGSHLDESAWVPIGVVALGSAAGELLFALTGMMFGNLDITWSAVGQVLPASVVYDVLLSPFVLYAVVRARALAAPTLATQGLASFPGGSARVTAAGRPLAVPGLAGAAALFSGSGAVLRDSGTGRRPEAEGPGPAGRIYPGRLGQRDAARPGPAVAPGAPEVQRRRGFRPVRRGGRGRPGQAGAGIPAGEPAPGQRAPAQPEPGRQAGGNTGAGQLAAWRRDSRQCLQPV